MSDWELAGEVFTTSDGVQLRLFPSSKIVFCIKVVAMKFVLKVLAVTKASFLE